MLDLAVDALAAYRLTRLVTADSITQGPRDAIIDAAYTLTGRYPSMSASAEEQGWQGVAESDPDVPKLAELVTCRWCAGMWVSLGIVAVARRYRWWPPLAQALAMSAAAALLAQLEDD